MEDGLLPSRGPQGQGWMVGGVGDGRARLRTLGGWARAEEKLSRCWAGSLLVPKSLQKWGRNSSPPQSPLAIGLIIPQRQAHACGLGNLVFLET